VDSGRRAASYVARRAADEVRAVHQFENREGNRVGDSKQRPRKDGQSHQLGVTMAELDKDKSVSLEELMV
jgi:hypothetical protein